MKKIKNHLIIFAEQILFFGIVIFLTPTLSYGQKAGAQPSPIPPPQNVKVVNSASEPVPVAGTVTVGNTESQPVPIVGTVNVGNLGTTTLPVSGTVSVQNAGSNPLQVREVNSQALQPFTSLATLAIPANASFIRAKATKPIPAGKRLLVEYISAWCATNPGQRPAMQLNILDANDEDAFFVPRYSFQYQYTDQGGLDHWVISELVRFYTPPGGSIEVKFIRVPTAESVIAFCQLNTSGDLVDLP